MDLLKSDVQDFVAMRNAPDSTYALLGRGLDEVANREEAAEAGMDYADMIRCTRSLRSTSTSLVTPRTSLTRQTRCARCSASRRRRLSGACWAARASRGCWAARPRTCPGLPFRRTRTTPRSCARSLPACRMPSTNCSTSTASPTSSTTGVRCEAPHRGAQDPHGSELRGLRDGRRWEPVVAPPAERPALRQGFHLLHQDARRHRRPLQDGGRLHRFSLPPARVHLPQEQEGARREVLRGREEDRLGEQGPQGLRLRWPPRGSLRQVGSERGHGCLRKYDVPNFARSLFL